MARRGVGGERAHAYNRKRGHVRLTQIEISHSQKHRQEHDELELRAVIEDRLRESDHRHDADRLLPMPWAIHQGSKDAARKSKFQGVHRAEERKTPRHAA